MKILSSRWRHALQGLQALSLLRRFALTALVVFIIIGAAVGHVLSDTVQDSALNAAESAAFDNQKRLTSYLQPVDLLHAVSGKRERRLNRMVHRDVLTNRIVVVKIWNRRGVVVYSTDRSIIGRKFPLEDDVEGALAGKTFADVSNLSAKEDVADRHFGTLLQVYIPIRFGTGLVIGAFEIYETYGPLGAQIASLQRTSYEVLGAGLLLLYLLLFGIVRTGSNTISRQQKRLQAHALELERSYADHINSLAAAVDARDAQTELHSERVTDLALRLGRRIALPAGRIEALRNGAQLHDIGKIGVPDAILLKPGALTDEEWRIMRGHPLTGFDMIKHVSFLHDALPIVRHHHERWDGKGYPDGLAGENIPVEARIFALADAFDAIVSDRPYRCGRSAAEALDRIERGAGSHFDPRLASAFVVMVAESFAPNAAGTDIQNQLPISTAPPRGVPADPGSHQKSAA